MDLFQQREARRLALEVAGLAEHTHRPVTDTACLQRFPRRQQRLADPQQRVRATPLLPTIWSTDLRVAVNQTMTGAGPNVQAAAQEALDVGTVDAYLAYLNDGLYVARALDVCVAQPAPSTPGVG